MRDRKEQESKEEKKILGKDKGGRRHTFWSNDRKGNKNSNRNQRNLKRTRGGDGKKKIKKQEGMKGRGKNNRRCRGRKGGEMKGEERRNG